MTSHSNRYTSQQLRDFLQWDISTWRHALAHFDQTLARHFADRDPTGIRALDLGARDGGLSAWLALKGFHVTCTDLDGPSQQAHDLHKTYGVEKNVRYRAVDATNIPADDGTYDLVVFKSILGGVGSEGDFAAIERAVGEMHRVLKPGGLLLFAENLHGSGFHRWARSRFVAWGNVWYYLTLNELDRLLGCFASHELYTYGFFSCIRKDFAPFVLADAVVCRGGHSQQHYMGFGHAIRQP